MRRHSGFGWLELLIGVVLIALGILTLAKPGLALTGLALACGGAAVIMGVADIVLYIEVERFTGFGPIVSLISGILSVMSGVMLLVYPGAGAMVMTLLFPIWFIAHCISRLMHLSHIRVVAGDGICCFSLIVNIIGLVLGFLMLMSPMLTLVAVRLLAGAYFILLGIDGVIMAFSPMGRRW